MHSEITCLFALDIKPGMLSSFKSLVAEIVSVVRNEPGTILYEYSANEQGDKAFIVERYKDSASIISHVDESFGPFAERFLSFVSITSLVIQGTPSADARHRLDAFSPLYMTPFDGCKKWA